MLLLPSPTKELKELKWAEQVTALRGSSKGTYVITTKPDMLKIQLTEKLGFGDTLYDHKYNGVGKLKEPITVSLPQYKIYISKNYFRFALKSKPKKPNDIEIGRWPQYTGLVGIGSWRGIFTPCYGDYPQQEDGTNIGMLEAYRMTDSWKDKANIATYFLQTAEPHYGNKWYRTAFAYRMGLVGKEVLAVTQKEIEEQATLSRQNRVHTLYGANAVTGLHFF